MRRVVTGVDESGRATVTSDQEIPGHAFQAIPGMRATMLWATAAGPVDRSGADPVPTLRHDLPGHGETRFHLIQFPPERVFLAPGFDAEAAAAEQRAVSPDLSERFEPGSAGTHTTDTTDYTFVLAGTIVLELDDGVEVELRQGDALVQNGTRHTWHNRSDSLALLGVVWVGPTSAGP
jgi:hypothetical protein